MKIKPLFVLVVLLFSFLNNSNSQTLKDDSLALVNFYNSTGGTNWTKKTNWLSGRVNSWHGIIISSERVVQINLPNNNLSGRIDSQFNLSALNTLTINNNSITELNLSNLPAINKIQANNNIINNVFFNANSNYYNNLSEVYLAYNSFSSIDISKLSSLTLFTAAYNRNLTTVITNATHGYYYRINSFSTGITSVSSLNLQGMRSATMLFVQDSKLESLDLSGFDKLTLIRVYRNKIKTFNISDLKSIEVFQGYNNQISEFITNNQANFYSNLKELQLQVNQISSLDISNCPIIEICNARENVITNFITNPAPDYYAKLYDLSLSYNQFFKINISNMPALKTCALGAKVQSNSPDIKRNTNFTQLITNSTPGYYYQISYLGFAYTAIPSVDLKGMETLNELYSNYSKLSSLDLSEHPNLTSLILDNNELATIHLSSSPGFYSKLYNLQLGYNKLTAIDISNLPVLKTAFLNNNKFITLDVSKNPLLEIFYAQYNQLTSFITNNEMDYYKKLHDFKISFNQLSRVNISNMPALVTCALGAKGVLSGNTYVRNENLKQIVTNPKEGYYYQITYLGFSDSEMSTIDLTGMENLKELNAPNCKISSLNLSNLNSLQKITITNNYLTFEDFEPIISKAIPTRIFFPQSSVNLFYNPSIYSFSVRVGGANNKYQWRKNGVNIAGATSPSYTISANDYNTNAQYQCVITNTIVTGLTLYSVIKRPQDSFTDLSSTFYISRASGNWNDNTTWQLFDGTSYIDAQTGEIPGENNSVYLEANHAIILNTNASCKDLNLNCTADVIRLNTGENTLDIYGKIRSYTGSVPGISSTSAGVPNWITTGTNGRIRLKGTTNRVIAEKDEFSDHENLRGWTLQCDLAEGVIGTINSNFRAGNVKITSGNLEVKSKNFKVSK